MSATMIGLGGQTMFTTNAKIARRHHGVALIYAAVTMVALMAIASLAVDLARVRLTKTQLQGAVDAAARAAAGQIPNGSSAVQARAIAIGAANSADGSAVVINSSDVLMGVWDSNARTFTTTNTNPNAVKVTAHRTAAAGNAVPLLFGRIIGRSACDVNASTVVMLTGSAPVQVPGYANPWLAGMPNGNYGGLTVSGIAPQNSPVQITSIAIIPGSTLTFQVTGSCADDPININKAWSPDGCSDGTGLRTNDSGYLNGMSQLNSQQGSLVGVFLDNTVPTSGSAPPNLDMSTTSAMNYSTISPALKQPFFIGDGKNNATGAQQSVVVPAGATRLYLGMHDNINWDNNSGYLIVSLNGTASPHVITVK
jgi:Flp pilus assembly protein TadG